MWGPEIVESVADCVNPGKTYMECQIEGCGFKSIGETPALGHTMSIIGPKYSCSNFGSITSSVVGLPSSSTQPSRVHSSNSLPSLVQM